MEIAAAKVLNGVGLGFAPSHNPSLQPLARSAAAVGRNGLHFAIGQHICDTTRMPVHRQLSPLLEVSFQYSDPFVFK